MEAQTPNKHVETLDGSLETVNNNVDGELGRRLNAALVTFQSECVSAVQRRESQLVSQSVVEQLLLNVERADLETRSQHLEERTTKLRGRELALKVAEQSFAKHKKRFAKKRREEQQYVLQLRKKLISDFAVVQQKLDASQRLGQELTAAQKAATQLAAQLTDAEKRLYNLRLHIANTPRPGLGLQQAWAVAHQTAGSGATAVKGLKSLPDALLLDIFSFLDVRGVTRTSLTSWTMHTRCTSLFTAPAAAGTKGARLSNAAGSDASAAPLTRKDRRLVARLQEALKTLKGELEKKEVECRALREASVASQEQIAQGSRAVAEARRQVSQLELQKLSDHEVISFMDGRIQELERRAAEREATEAQLRAEIAELQKNS